MVRVLLLVVVRLVMLVVMVGSTWTWAWSTPTPVTPSRSATHVTLPARHRTLTGGHLSFAIALDLFATLALCLFV